MHNLRQPETNDDSFESFIFSSLQFSVFDVNFYFFF